jgi:hypothetical protein
LIVGSTAAAWTRGLTGVTIEAAEGGAVPNLR